MASRFSSGSVTPLRAAKNSSRASTISTGTLSFLNSPTTRWGSPARIRPFSMNTVFSRGPSARWPSRVTVDESTPPESALMANPSPTVSRISATFSSMNRLVTSRIALISFIMGPLHRSSLRWSHPGLNRSAASYANSLPGCKGEGTIVAGQIRCTNRAL